MDEVDVVEKNDKVNNFIKDFIEKHPEMARSPDEYASLDKINTIKKKRMKVEFKLPEELSNLHSGAPSPQSYLSGDDKSNA
mmetsp:Transcript_18404/g.16061  ORF Transcript_18404/g.16061 Transcript_18404/m.16061 type:complete len:81 (-) Transcript_18404:173-415(-)